MTQQPGSLPSGLVEALHRVSARLKQITDRYPGTAVEYRPTAAVLHTRGADRPTAAAATRAALEGPARWEGVHPIAGKDVVELAVTDVTDVTKGSVLRLLRARTGPAPGGVTVKVGDGDTAARHRIADPPAVARLLQAIAALRSR